MSINHLLSENNYDIYAKSIKIGDGSPIADFYESPNFSYNVTGGIENGHALNGKYIVLNNLVILMLYNLYAPSSSSNDYITTADNVVPLNLRPPADAYMPAMIWNNSSIFIGIVKVTTSGQIVLYVSNGNKFVSSGNNGIAPSVISWAL